ncbi:hypothetical protein DL769_003948 [Monosporascus sp. CRB-8-3]|nr:hypothetical protein DL769_003948 [Monosporascus sp. CRB-8-3]
MADGEPVPGSLYVYAPNKGAPIFFTVAYGLSAVGHIWQCFRYKCWKLMCLQVLCAVLFTVGYAMREYGAYNYLYLIPGTDTLNDQNLMIFILSQVFIYICPPLLELSNYHILGRLFYYVPYFAPLAPNRVLSTFGALMALVETLNALGVALSSNSSSSASQQTLGSNLSIASLVLQLCVIAIFGCLAGIFHRRCAKANIHARTIQTTLATLCVSMALILIRCIYRLVEHTGNTEVDLDNPEALGELTPILRYEWFFYVFEATLMFINSVLWNIWNPGRYIPRRHSVYLSPDGAFEIEGEEKEDDRSLLARAGHIFTFGILFHRKYERPTSIELSGHSRSDR